MFDSLADAGLEFLVLYLKSKSPKANWGEIVVGHPFVVGDHGLWAELKWFAALLRAQRLKVVVCFGYRGRLRVLTLLAARFRRLPIVTRSDSNIVGLGGDSVLKKDLRKALYRMLYPRRTRIWTIGQANSDFWKAYIGRHNTRLIPYSTPRLPDSLHLPIQRRRSDPLNLKFLFVGRLVPVKDIDTLIAAFKGLDQSGEQNWRLDIVGEGPLAERLGLRATSDPRIDLHGAVRYDELDRFYTTTDVLVLPSASEPWGLVVNEALAFGLRVIVSDHVGSAELLTSPALGDVFKVGDTAGLIECMRASVGYLERVPVPPYDPTSDMADDLRSLVGKKSDD